MKIVSGSFATRRDAEMAVERLVQEHGIDRDGIFIASAAAANSAGVRKEGADAACDPLEVPRDSRPALIEDGEVETVCASFKEFGADSISTK